MRPILSVPTFCAVFIAAIILTYAALNIWVKPVVWSDSGFGLLVWDARHERPFNEMAEPDSRDLSKETGGFMVAWSPGQYLLPGLLEDAGLSLGAAIVVVVTVFSILGLWGWLTLYTAFGFPLRTAAIALAIIAGTRHFSFPFGIYVGGEPLLFGIAPWFLLLVWKLSDLRWYAILPLAAGTAAMFFAKLNGIVLSAAAISAAVLSAPKPWKAWRETVRKGFIAGATLAIIGIAFYYAWYRHGWSGAVGGSVFDWSNALAMAVLAFSSTWGASLSFGDLGNYIFSHPSRPIFRSPIPIAVVMTIPAAVTFYFVWRRLRASHAKYLRFAVLTALAYGLVLVWIRARGGMIGEEERYFRIVSLLFFIGIVQTALDLPYRSARLAALVVGLLCIAYGLSSQTAHLLANLRYPLGVREFRHSTANNDVIKFIREIDVASPDRASTLIYVTSPEIGLEVRYVRVMANHADFVDAKDLATVTYRGRVPHLYFIVQNSLIADGKAEIMLKSFRDYPIDEWKKIPLGDFTAFHAGTAPR